MKSIKVTDKAKLYNGKSENVIPKLDDDSIDLVITSPPYNVDLGNNKFNESPYDLYKDNKSHADYIVWLKDLFEKLYPKLKSGGRVCINIGDGQNGRVPTHSDIIHFMTHELNYLPMANIIWNKSQIGNRFAWGSFASPSAPSFPKPFEYIMVFAKEHMKLQSKGETDIDPEEFKKWAFSVWNMTAETKMKKIGHPAMFPVELPYRLIKMLSWTNATVLDIFNGAGTTGVACEKLGSKYIGIEMSKKYCDLTAKRIKETRPLVELDMFSGEPK
jgi:site-specific DNA-methyltransferase (adenine-specific)